MSTDWNENRLELRTKTVPELRTKNGTRTKNQERYRNKDPGTVLLSTPGYFRESAFGREQSLV